MARDSAQITEVKAHFGKPSRASTPCSGTHGEKTEKAILVASLESRCHRLDIVLSKMLSGHSTKRKCCLHSAQKGVAYSKPLGTGRSRQTTRVHRQKKVHSGSSRVCHTLLRSRSFQGSDSDSDSRHGDTVSAETLLNVWSTLGADH
jgi:hypothetical protein